MAEERQYIFTSSGSLVYYEDSDDVGNSVGWRQARKSSRPDEILKTLVFLASCSGSYMSSYYISGSTLDCLYSAGIGRAPIDIQLLRERLIDTHVS